MNISFDYYSISLLIGGFTALLSGFVVFIHNHKTTENIAWFLFNITSAIWSFGYFATITAQTRNVAFISDWILHLAATLVPLFCLLSVVSITDTYRTHRKGIMLASIMGLLFLISTPSELFVRDVMPKAHFNFVPDAGPLYVPFTIYFFSLVVYVLYILFKKYLISTNIIERQRYKYMFIFTMLGSIGGGSVFFITFNVPLLPYPIILFSLFPIISIYAIFRFQLFNVKVISTEFLVFSLWIAILIRTVLAETSRDQLINFTFLMVAVFLGIFLIRSIIKEVTQREKIEKLAEELKQINVGQNSMIHFMNHQIKGRFGIAKNIFAELLSEDYGKMPEETIPLIKKGLEETNTGINYVQSILKGATAENGSLQYDKKPMDFKELVENVVKHQKEKAEGKGLQFNLNIEDGDYKTNGDSLQLGEAVRNLMDNSINYTLQGSISVKLNFSLNNMKLQVIDTGVGITPEDMVNLFKAGGRGANSLKVNVNSTGYGLVFVKNVVEAHGGKVWVESRGEGKGSTFSVELPKTI